MKLCNISDMEYALFKLTRAAKISRSQNFNMLSTRGKIDFIADKVLKLRKEM